MAVYYSSRILGFYSLVLYETMHGIPTNLTCLLKLFVRLVRDPACDPPHGPEPTTSQGPDVPDQQAANPALDQAPPMQAAVRAVRRHSRQQPRPEQRH